MSTSKIVREASELGFSPGIWPKDVTVEGVRYFRANVVNAADGELVAVIYYTAGYTARLDVLND